MAKAKGGRQPAAKKARQAEQRGGVAKPTPRPKASTAAAQQRTAAAAAAAAVAAAGLESVLAAPPANSGKPNRPPTAFEERLYAVCKRIPPGRVATYGTLAEVLHSAPRACGQALRRNPFAPVVPCHRVIAASLELGGFSGSWGVGCANVQRKRQMLEEEGVPFDERTGRLLPSAARCVMTAEELRAAAAGVL